MNNRPARVRLEDLKQAMARVRQYTAGLTYDHFINDEKTMDAVLRNLEVIGEAARNLPEQLRSKYPDVEWHRMIGLRNIISHEYFGVDTQIFFQYSHYWYGDKVALRAGQVPLETMPDANVFKLQAQARW